jgi:DNA-binding response OmpR family regulator
MNRSTAGTVFVVEDDEKTASLISLYLERAGFVPRVLADGSDVLARAQRFNPVMVILDLMLPRGDGWDICRELRSATEVPILIVSARDEEFDRVLGLTLGADDYLVKPFSPRELVARVKAILRRAGPLQGTGQHALCHGPLTLDAAKHAVTLEDEPVQLTPTEFVLLEVLMRTPGRVFSREALLDRLYPTGGAVGDRVVDVHIGNVRQKIEKNPAQPTFILTVRGVGYRFAENSAATG